MISLLLSLSQIWPVGFLLIPVIFCQIPMVISILPYFLAQQNAPGSSCTFPEAFLKPAISLKDFWFIEVRMAFEKQELGSRLLIATMCN